MSRYNERNSMGHEPQINLNEGIGNEEYSCWEDFEYIETFLPRNIDFCTF